MPLCVVDEQWSRLITSAGLFWSHGGNRRRFMARWWQLILVLGVGGDEDTDAHAEHASFLRTHKKKNTFHTNLSPPRLWERFGGVRRFDFQPPVINEVASKPPLSTARKQQRALTHAAPSLG